MPLGSEELYALSSLVDELRALNDRITRTAAALCAAIQTSDIAVPERRQALTHAWLRAILDPSLTPTDPLAPSLPALGEPFPPEMSSPSILSPATPTTFTDSEATTSEIHHSHEKELL